MLVYYLLIPHVNHRGILTHKKDFLVDTHPDTSYRRVDCSSGNIAR